MFYLLSSFLQALGISSFSNFQKENKSNKFLSAEDVNLKGCFWDDARYYAEKKHETWQSSLNKSTEKHLYEFLSEHIDDKYYVLLPHVSLREIFRPKSEYNLGRLSSFHVDFLIMDKRTWCPVFAIEYDGMQHEKDCLQQKRDFQKGQLLRQHNIPVLNVNKTSPYDDITFYNNWIDLQKKEGYFPSYHSLCGTRMNYMVGINGPYYECPKCVYGENEKYPGKHHTLHADHIVVFHP